MLLVREYFTVTDKVDFQLMEHLIKDNNAQIKARRCELREGFAQHSKDDSAE